MLAHRPGLWYFDPVALRSDQRGLFGGGGRGEKAAAPTKASTPDKEIAGEVDGVEKDIHELRATYELFYMGVEKLEPLTQRNILKAKLRRWQEMRPRNTALKFKVQQLKARLVSLENYWERTNRQREAGTYRRDKTRAARREAEEIRDQIQRERTENPRQATVLGAQAPGVNGQMMGSAELKPPASRAATSAQSGASRGSRPSANSAEDLTDPKLRRLYQTYMGARRRCGEATDLRYEDMASSLRKQVPRLMNQTGAGSVEFKVVIRKGKAVLKALPKNVTKP
jgi:hypothetical protein